MRIKEPLQYQVRPFRKANEFLQKSRRLYKRIDRKFVSIGWEVEFYNVETNETRFVLVYDNQVE